MADRNDPLGFDAYLDSDLDRGGRNATGVELVANAIPHRLTCETLPCIDAPNGEIEFGIDVRKWVGEATTKDDLDARIPLVDGALHLDPRIAFTRIAMSLETGGVALPDKSLAAYVIAIEVTTIAGDTISRIVGVSGVSVDFLAQG